MTVPLKQYMCHVMHQCEETDVKVVEDVGDDRSCGQEAQCGQQEGRLIFMTQAVKWALLAMTSRTGKKSKPL